MDFDASTFATAYERFKGAVYTADDTGEYDPYSLTWEQIQHYLLTEELISAEDAANMGYDWKN